MTQVYFKSLRCVSGTPCSGAVIGEQQETAQPSVKGSPGAARLVLARTTKFPGHWNTYPECVCDIDLVQFSEVSQKLSFRFLAQQMGREASSLR